MDNHELEMKILKYLRKRKGCPVTIAPICRMLGWSPRPREIRRVTSALRRLIKWGHVAMMKVLSFEGYYAYRAVFK